MQVTNETLARQKIFVRYDGGNLLSCIDTRVQFANFCLLLLEIVLNWRQVASASFVVVTNDSSSRSRDHAVAVSRLFSRLGSVVATIVRTVGRAVMHGRIVLRLKLLGWLHKLPSRKRSRRALVASWHLVVAGSRKAVGLGRNRTV